MHRSCEDEIGPAGTFLGMGRVGWTHASYRLSLPHAAPLSVLCSNPQVGLGQHSTHSERLPTPLTHRDVALWQVKIVRRYQAIT